MLDKGYDPTWPYVELDQPKVTFKAAIHQIEPKNVLFCEFHSLSLLAPTGQMLYKQGLAR
jgi:hypothetical protein